MQCSPFQYLRRACLYGEHWPDALPRPLMTDTGLSRKWTQAAWLRLHQLNNWATTSARHLSSKYNQQSRQRKLACWSRHLATRHTNEHKRGQWETITHDVVSILDNDSPLLLRLAETARQTHERKSVTKANSKWNENKNTPSLCYTKSQMQAKNLQIWFLQARNWILTSSQQIAANFNK